MKKAAKKITLLDIYKYIEGPLNFEDCLFDTRIFCSKRCIFDGLLGDISRQFKDFLEMRKGRLFLLAKDLVDAYRFAFPFDRSQVDLS